MLSCCAQSGHMHHLPQLRQARLGPGYIMQRAASNATELNALLDVQDADYAHRGVGGGSSG